MNTSTCLPLAASPKRVVCRAHDRSVANNNLDDAAKQVLQAAAGIGVKLVFDAFQELLAVTYPTTAQLEGVEWAEAEEVLRRHQVTGGLTPQERERMWTEWCTTVRTRDAV